MLSAFVKKQLNNTMRNKNRIYAAYRGERWLTDGTVQELAEEFNLTRRRVSWLCTPTAHKRISSKPGARGLLFYFVDYEEFFDEDAKLLA